MARARGRQMAGCHAYETWYIKSESRPLGYPPVDYKEAGEYVNEEIGVREKKYIVNLMVGEIFCRWEGCRHTIRYARTIGLSQHYRDKHQCVAPPLAPGKKTQGGRHSQDRVARSFDFYDAWRAACAQAIRKEDAKTEMANNSKAYTATDKMTNETTVKVKAKEATVTTRVHAKSKDVSQEQPVDKEPIQDEPHGTATSARQTRQQKRQGSVKPTEDITKAKTILDGKATEQPCATTSSFIKRESSPVPGPSLNPIRLDSPTPSPTDNNSPTTHTPETSQTDRYPTTPEEPQSSQEALSTDQALHQAELIHILVADYGHYAHLTLRKYDANLDDDHRWPTIKRKGVLKVNASAARKALGIKKQKCVGCADKKGQNCNGHDDGCELFVHFGDPDLAEFVTNSFDQDELRKACEAYREAQLSNGGLVRKQ